MGEGVAKRERGCGPSWMGQVNSGGRKDGGTENGGEWGDKGTKKEREEESQRGGRKKEKEWKRIRDEE